MTRPRPLTERLVIYCTEKDETCRTPFIEHYRVGEKFTKLHGHVLDSPEDHTAQEALNASCQAAHEKMLADHAATIRNLFENPTILTASSAA